MTNFECISVLQQEKSRIEQTKNGFVRGLIGSHVDGDLDVSNYATCNFESRNAREINQAKLVRLCKL